MAVMTAGIAAEIANTTIEDIETLAEDLTKPANPLWFKLVQERGWKKIKKGGYVLSKALNVDDMDDQVQDYNPANANFTFTSPDVFDKGQWGWKYSVGHLVYGEFEVTQNTGKDERVDIIKGKSEGLLMSMQRRICAQVLGAKNRADLGSGATAATMTDAVDTITITGDTNTQRLIGMPVVVSQTKNYATLNPTTIGELWQCQANALWTVDAVADITVPAITNWLIYCIDGREKDKFVLCRPPLWGYLVKLLFPNQRYAENKDLTKVGFTNFEFNGVAFVSTWEAANGYMHLFDNKYMELYFDPSRAITKGETSYKIENKQWISEVNSMLFLRCTRRKFTHGLASGDGLLDSNLSAAMVA